MKLFYDFMIAIFGSLILTVSSIFRLNRENKSNNELKEKSHDYLNRLREWENKVADQKLAEHLAGYLYNMKDGFEFTKNDPNGIFEEINNTLKEMNWLSYKDCVLIMPKTETREFYLRILMANRGKLLPSDATCGIKAFSACGHKPENTAEFVLWIDKKLKEHGIIENPVYEEELYDDYKNMVIKKYHYLNKPVSDAFKFMWRPNISFQYEIT